MARTHGRAPQTLAGTWTRTLARLLLVMIGLGAMAFATTQYQRSTFASTTSEVEAEMAGLVGIEQSLIPVAEPVGLILYRLGGPEKANAALREYQGGRRAVYDAFTSAKQTASTPEILALLRRAEHSFAKADAAILAAPTDWPDATLGASLLEGVDPFRVPVLDELGAMDQTLANVRSASVSHLGERTDEIDRVQGLIGPLVLGVLAIGILLAWLATRRLARRVLGPLAEIGRATTAMGSSELQTPIEVPGAIAEVQQLACTLNAAAEGIRASHGLLRTQAYTDSLTHLPNRKAFTEQLDRQLGASSGRTAVLFVDLDDFKIVNDTLGHAAGDELLHIVAERLLNATRECEMVARLGGDEFAVAIECGDRAATAVTVAERILAALDHPASIEGTVVEVGCSIGVSVAELGAGVAAADELLRNADFAMYMAKSQGKNCFEVYSPRMHAEMLGRMELKRDLGQAVRLEQLELHYQPVLDLGSGSLLGFEALVRWQHPTRGLLPPGEFIGLAEDTGAILDIGTWVLDEACRALAAHHAEPDCSSLWMSVNVSPNQLTGNEFVDVVTSTLDRHGIEPGALVLEITEAAAMGNTGVAVEVLGALRALGVHVALDDFGTGFSSLRYLGDLPVDVIKIDRSFVAGTGGTKGSMLEAIVAIAQGLDLKIIAEGIEEPEQLERLRALGQLAGQGFLFARPMPDDAAGNYRREHEVASDIAS